MVLECNTPNHTYIITHLSKPHVCHHPVNLAWLDCFPPAQNNATALDQARLHDNKDICALLEPLMEKSPQVRMHRECSSFAFSLQSVPRNYRHDKNYYVNQVKSKNHISTIIILSM